MLTEVQMYRMTINGEAVDGSREPLQIHNPATEELLSLAPNADTVQLGLAVQSAATAFRTWRNVDVEERRAVVRRIADAVEVERVELARLLTREQGKPLYMAQAEIDRSIAWARGVADIEWGDTIVLDDDVHRVTVRQMPLGVVGAIVPWNFPVTLAMWKIAPALITGNTVILKPSPYTPLTALRIGEIVRDIVPAGVLNVISGGDDLGPAMTAHPDIAKIAFTGSSATGKKIMASAAATLKRVTLELGGNDAAVVLPDIDVDAVVEEVFWGCFANSSQYCLATKRLYLHEDIHAEFLAAFIAYARTVVLGNGLDDGTQMGPIQNKMQYDKVQAYIAESEAAGHKIVYRAEVTQEKGYFVGPIIVDVPPEDSRLVREEPFGPILPVLTFVDDDDVIARVNDSLYGLGGSVWGADIERATRIAERISSGMVWVNEIHRLSPFFPMGGHRQSGIGRENGIEGLLEYCDSQSLAVKKTPGAK